MKDPMPGFVPVNFKRAGIILLSIGLIIIVASVISHFTSLYSLSNYVLYFGAAAVLLSLYLIYVVPKEK